jgi:hypothetical protein
MFLKSVLKYLLQAMKLCQEKYDKPQEYKKM